MLAYGFANFSKNLGATSKFWAAEGKYKPRAILKAQKY
jgi:hypothetical protein